MDPNNQIPLIDFEPYYNGDILDRHKVASAIDKALSTTGFIYLTNHGIEQRKVDEVFIRSRQFFSLPEVTKRIIQHTRGDSIRGYIGFGEENVRQVASVKECFDSGNPNEQESPNLWLSEEILPGFRDFMEDFYQDCTKVMHKLLECLSLALNLGDAESLGRHHIESLFNLSLTHYSSLSGNDPQRGDSIRMPAHSDFGSLTFLFQDDVGGLEVADTTTGDTISAVEFNEKGKFRKVEPKPGTMIVNVGYLLMRWSNGRWKNTIHRVVEPPAAAEDQGLSDPVPTSNNGSGSRTRVTRERFSIPFFASPDPTTIVETLPGCWSAENPKKWKPLNVGDFLRRKRKSVYA